MNTVTISSTRGRMARGRLGSLPGSPDTTEVTKRSSSAASKMVTSSDRLDRGHRLGRRGIRRCDPADALAGLPIERPLLDDDLQLL